MSNNEDEPFQEILIRHLRSHRDQLESTLALQVRTTLQYKAAEESRMKRLEKMREAIIPLMKFASKEHRKCVGRAGEGLVGKCDICFALGSAKEILERFTY